MLLNEINKYKYLFIALDYYSMQWLAVIVISSIKEKGLLPSPVPI